MITKTELKGEIQSYNTEYGYRRYTLSAMGAGLHALYRHTQADRSTLDGGTTVALGLSYNFTELLEALYRDAS